MENSKGDEVEPKDPLGNWENSIMVHGYGHLSSNEYCRFQDTKGCSGLAPGLIAWQFMATPRRQTVSRWCWSTLIATLAIATLALTACGGSDSGDLDGSDPVDNGSETGADDADVGGSGTEAELTQAATDMFLAYLAADDQTYFNFLSRECRERLEFAAVGDHLSGRRFRGQNAGIDLSTLGVASVDVFDFSGDSASVALMLSGTTELFEESIPNEWVYEDGGWHRDDCANITEPQGGLEGYGTNRDDPVPYGGVADINGWLITVSWIDPDSEELIVELGGEPASEGNLLFNIQLNPSYNGAEATTVLGEDLAFAMVNGSTVYDDAADCASSDPAFLDLGIEAGPGEDIGLPFLCREVAAGHAASTLLRVTDLATGTEYWFDLTPP